VRVIEVARDFLTKLRRFSGSKFIAFMKMLGSYRPLDGSSNLFFVSFDKH
jgi:hypothetical protein